MCSCHMCGTYQGPKSLGREYRADIRSRREEPTNDLVRYETPPVVGPKTTPDTPNKYRKVKKKHKNALDQ